MSEPALERREERVVKRRIMAARPRSCIACLRFSSVEQGMPFGGSRYRFTRSMVDGAPADPGVYALWQGDELIYYGRASGSLKSIKFALLEHLSGGGGPCTHHATHYSWEISVDPAAREAELLAEYEATFNRLPRCNQAAG